MIHKKLILLVDDYPKAALLSSILLTKMGYQTHHASRMAGATSWLEQYSCDAVIADLLLEGDKGEELLGWMCINKRPEPVIIMSEDADDDLNIRLLALGAHALLTKPLEAGPLRRTLDAALGLRLPA